MGMELIEGALFRLLFKLFGEGVGHFLDRGGCDG